MQMIYADDDGDNRLRPIPITPEHGPFRAGKARIEERNIFPVGAFAAGFTDAHTLTPEVDLSPLATCDL
jgi:hypothetical protein